MRRRAARASPCRLSWQAGLSLLAGLASSPVATAADLTAGRRAFAPCASCHAIGPNARNGFGPQLKGLLGRRAGSLPDYAYSPAMKASGLMWTEATLAAFIRNPGQVVPGTTMRFFGYGYDERKLADLMAYLRARD